MPKTCNLEWDGMQWHEASGHAHPQRIAARSLTRMLVALAYMLLKPPEAVGKRSGLDKYLKANTSKLTSIVILTLGMLIGRASDDDQSSSSDAATLDSSADSYTDDTQAPVDSG